MLFVSSGTASPQFSALSLHDALPIYLRHRRVRARAEGALSGEPHPEPRFAGRLLCALRVCERCATLRGVSGPLDRKSTRLNSSHMSISYAVFCLKKKSYDIADAYPEA